MLLVGGAAVAIGASRWLLRARVPDDWDSIGFLLALDDFDLARFQPHFPGYPVFVALGRLAHLGLRAPLDAACAVSAIASAATAAGLFSLVRALHGERVAFAAVGLYGAAALPWICGGAALSDGTAVAFAVLAFAALVEGRALVGGVLIGLLLGVRAACFPLALSWLAAAWAWRRATLGRALWGAAAGVIAWAVPFVLVVGVRQIVALGRVHLAGHFADWGGSIATRPGLAARAFAFGRALVFDGIAPSCWALLALLAIALAPPRVRPSRRALQVACVVAAPYALWAFFAQNVVEQPRHLLPLVVAALLALACALDGWRAVVAIAVVAASSLPVAIAHRRTTPAAAQLVEHVAASAGSETALFGGRSIRFAHLLQPSLRAYERTWLSEVDVTLERLDVLPRRILITSEVEIDPTRAARVRPGPRFCRPLVVERAQRCLQLSEYFIGGRAP
jgi:hypothetical protein